MRRLRYHAGLRCSITAILFVLAQLIVGALVAAQPAVSNDRFDRLFAQSLAKRQSLASISARFTETTTSSLLEKPLVSHGTVIAAPPARVLMTYTDPERRIVTIDGKFLVVEWPDRQERQKIDISQTQKRIDQYFTQASTSQLRSMFDITAEDDPGVRGTDRVDMRPKRKQIKEGLERLELWVERERLLLVQMRMTFPGGDRKTIRLEDIAVNVPVPDATFRIPP
jgi:outer membrane lipoprotein-sorting protein